MVKGGKELQEYTKKSLFRAVKEKGKELLIILLAEKRRGK